MVYLNCEQTNSQTFFPKRYLDKDNNHLYTQYNDMYQIYIMKYKMKIQTHSRI
jgi:hypothetical protein